ncbi:GGDEF domain-containing protein [Halopseudomonas salegens]|uniref:diguanylate cyclase n=1 Tax=Halopseudomonas salegens TaxID=1434072 RepID=A0A1H2HV89_9GAMM|nr:GGDEF domain-containing protein [Halopseudomonas salegens]SDU35777.1 diguanylate cyclase (GGDEF) domain-containing protein [Halopseudomonas salegens]
MLSNTLWKRFSHLLDDDLQGGDLPSLLGPRRHMLLLSRRRAILIVNRVRLFALLFAVLTPLWSLIDIMVFPPELWLKLLVLRLLVSATFFFLLTCYQPTGELRQAYKALAILFAIPTVFYISSHTLLGSFELHSMSEAVGAGYAFLPFVLMAGMAIFPLTLSENLVVILLVLGAQALAGYLSWSVLDWPSFAGAFWLLMLIGGVGALAGMSQLAFMLALVRTAIRDPLTGIFSRGSGEEILKLKWDAAQRNNSALALAFIDLDNFKALNDTWGHEAGDIALRDSAEHMLRSLRSADSLVRWGGEEFLLIMPDTDMTQARRALDRVTQQGLGLRPEGQPLTASIGLAELRFDRANSREELLQLADQRMYQAKQNGRNQVCAMSLAAA